MASWLKVAEDLLEVVDRRAKLVVSELSDEQSDSQPSASNGQGVQARRTKSKEKGQLRLSSNEPPKAINPEEEQISEQATVSTVTTDKVEVSPHEYSLDVGTNLTAEASTELPSDFTNKDTPLSDEAPQNAKDGQDDTNTAMEAPVTEDNIEVPISSANGDFIIPDPKGVEWSSPSPLVGKGIETVNGDFPADANPKVHSLDEDASLKVDEEKPVSEMVEIQRTSEDQENNRDLLPEPSQNMKNQQEHKSGTSTKVEDQLDEAQGLLKSAISTGQSKEARLAKVCAGLSSRLQEYKSENAQLEELLVAERECSSSYEARVKQLQQELSLSKTEVTRVESNMAAALATKNSEIEALVSSTDVLKKQAASSEGKLASLQTNMETIMRSRELTETRMMQALREEIASAERRVEEERAAHNATKMAAVDREVELEHRAVEASNALARIQRTADESTSRAMELEHKLAVLEAECASLNQELQDMEARARRGQKKSSEEASQILQHGAFNWVKDYNTKSEWAYSDFWNAAIPYWMQHKETEVVAWQEEVERARHGQRDAENKLSSLEAELQKMRVEMAGMKRDAEHYSRQEHMELEKRYRELTDLLYHKQTQLEAMASEKSAAEFQLEKEAKRHQEAQVEAERSRASRRASSSWEEDTDLKALEPLPLHHRHMVGASIQLQRAAKLLDSGAVRATRFLWRYPIARVILLFYLVFMHFFLMYLLHHLQEQADDFASREVAASMGLSNSSLP